MARGSGRFAGVTLAAALAAGGCSKTSAGRPVLLDAFWIAGEAHTLLYAATDAAVAPAPTEATAGASEIDFVFDRLLDGDRIEDTTAAGTAPKANPPITVSWPDAGTVASTPAFGYEVLYNSAALYGGATSYVLLKPSLPGFPSATTVTFTLDPSSLTSTDGEPMIGPSMLAAVTTPLAVSFQVAPADGGGAPVAASFTLPVAFSTRAASVAALTPFVRATADGAPLPVTLIADANDPALVFVSSGCAAGWPAGALVEVTVDAGAPDAFGIPLAASASVGFAVGGAPADGGTLASGGC